MSYVYIYGQTGPTGPAPGYNQVNTWTAQNTFTANTNLTGYVLIQNTLAATSTGTGALQISGGAGIAGNVFLSGNLVAGNAQIVSTALATSTATGALQIAGGAGIAGNVYVGGNVIIQNTLAATSTGTGALQVTGGAGISGNVYLGGNTVIANTLLMTGTAYQASTTNPTSGFNILLGRNNNQDRQLWLADASNSGVSVSAIPAIRFAPNNNVATYASAFIDCYSLDGTVRQALTLGSATVGNPQLYLAPSGNVGIGNPSPNYAVDISGALSTLQYTETMITTVTWAASLSINYITGLIYYFTPTGATTSLTITNVPTTLNKVYTFSFIFATTNSAYYISATTITINGTSYNLRGVSNISISSPAQYIIQQVSLIYNGSTFGAITTASGF